MLSKCVAFVILVILGCIASGSCEMAAERAERRRVEKWIQKRYGKTY